MMLVKTYPNNLKRQYEKYRVSAAEALEVLRKKALSQGEYYYIGRNKQDTYIEIFKGSMNHDNSKFIMTDPDEIDASLADKGLYLFCSPGGWLTIRRVPPDADDVLHLQQTDEKHE